MLAEGAFLLLALLHEPALSRFDYGWHIRPIVLRHCAGCHRDGGAAPMSLLDYQEAVPWANAMKLAILEGRMPPFLPADGSGPFLHSRSLSAEELDTLVDWAVGATPEGDPIEAAAPPAPEDLAPPDLALETDEVVLAEDESRKTICAVIETGLGGPRIATGYVVSSRAPSVLRRVTLFASDSCGGSSPFGTWLPDQDRVSFPSGFGREVGSKLALELEYVKKWEEEGKRASDRVEVGLTFGSGARPLRAMRIEDPEWTSPKAALLVALYPEPAEGSPVSVELVPTAGEARSLLEIERFDREFREKYLFREPVLLAPGSRLRVTHPPLWVELAEP